jgi:carbonic anhydrase
MKKLIFASALMIALNSCNQTVINNDEIITADVLTKEEQDKLTPDQVIEDLKAGNIDFIEDQLTVRNNTERVRNASLGQYPEAVILSCLDSRVPVEDIFHKAIGDLFVARVAGNVVNEDIIGSLEYACKVSGSKVVVVLGHEYCGAIKSSIDSVRLGYITNILEKIEPAIGDAKTHYKGDPTSKNPEFVDVVCKYNVINSINKIRSTSNILNEMEESGKIKIVGAIYDMKTGKVEFI